MVVQIWVDNLTYLWQQIGVSFAILRLYVNTTVEIERLMYFKGFDKYWFFGIVINVIHRRNIC